MKEKTVKPFSVKYINSYSTAAASMYVSFFSLTRFHKGLNLELDFIFLLNENLHSEYGTVLD